MFSRTSGQSTTRSWRLIQIIWRYTTTALISQVGYVLWRREIGDPNWHTGSKGEMRRLEDACWQRPCRRQSDTSVNDWVTYLYKHRFDPVNVQEVTYNWDIIFWCRVCGDQTWNGNTPWAPIQVEDDGDSYRRILVHIRRQHVGYTQQPATEYYSEEKG